MFLPVLALLFGCEREIAPVQLAGDTMGTTWHVTYVAVDSAPAAAQVRKGIEEQLEAVNASMSTYLAESEISRLNAFNGDTWVEISPGFYRVLAAAMDVGQRSKSAYDVTVAPLVDLWGFGPAGVREVPPDAHEVEAAMGQVGQHLIRLDQDGRRVSKPDGLSLDFSSLAKGYAVDQVAEWMLGQGIGQFLVEVGGEMRLSGLSGRGDPWRIAIEQPESSGRDVAVAIRLTDTAVATSGDYRNYFEADGRRYSHMIDPRTGYPVAHDLVSVTVVHPSCMVADAWATALAVVGSKEAMALAQEQGLAVYFIRRVNDNFVHSHTPLFSKYLPQPNL